ncbi:MAG: hypothetical protein H7Z21_12005 [Hymenobacter sp.]|nr:hypothetical protein [Hymenobacter sp.]
MPDFFYNGQLCAPDLVDCLDFAAMMSAALALGCPVEIGDTALEEWAKTAHIPAGPGCDGLLTVRRTSSSMATSWTIHSFNRFPPRQTSTLGGVEWAAPNKTRFRASWQPT